MTTLLFEPGRLKDYRGRRRRAVQSGQLDALLKLVSVTVGPDGVQTAEGVAKLLMSTPRRGLGLIRGGRGIGSLSGMRLTATGAPLGLLLEKRRKPPVSTNPRPHRIESRVLRITNKGRSVVTR